CRDDSGPGASGKLEPVKPSLEEGSSASHGFVVSPVFCTLHPARYRGELGKYEFPYNLPLKQRPQAHGQRLVVVILPDHYNTAGSIPCLTNGLVLVHVHERGFLHQHVLPRCECLQRQVVVVPRRNGYNDGIHIAALDRCRIAGEAAAATVHAPELVGAGCVPARIAADNVTTQCSQLPAVHFGDVTAAQECHTESAGRSGW